MLSAIFKLGMSRMVRFALQLGSLTPVGSKVVHIYGCVEEGLGEEVFGLRLGIEILNV